MLHSDTPAKATAGARHRTWPKGTPAPRDADGTGPARFCKGVGTIAPMAEGDQPLDEVLEEIGVQLAWVRDYL
jgi:hypothetical protein